MFIVALAVITIVAGGAGFGVSATMLAPASMSAASSTTADAQKAAAEQPAAHGSAPAHGEAGAAGEEAGPPKKLVVVDIPSITTNLFDPSDAWIRMELSLVFEEAADQIMAEDVHQDILAYVRTMKLYNLKGGSGYQHLMEDLNDRAAIRSGGRVKRILVRSLILE